MYPVSSVDSTMLLFRAYALAAHEWVWVERERGREGETIAGNILIFALHAVHGSTRGMSSPVHSKLCGGFSVHSKRYPLGRTHTGCEQTNASCGIVTDASLIEKKRVKPGDGNVMSGVL